MKYIYQIICFCFLSAICYAQPSNNDCANATPLTMGSIGVCNPYIDSNVGATASGVLPLPMCSQFGAGQDQWYSIVVPPSGDLTIEILDEGGPAGWDMDIAVYSGTCGSLVHIACNDGLPPAFFPKIDLYGQTPGSTLLIRAWEYFNNQTGDFNICSSIIAPENTICTGATPITCGYLLQNESTEFAIDNGDVTGCAMGTGLWYNFTPSYSGTTTLTVTPEASYDPEVSISTSSNCTTFTNVDCVDEAGNGGVETFVLNFTAGENYYFFVGDRLGLGSSVGTFDIALTNVQPSNDACGNATVLSLGSVASCAPLLQNNYCATSSIATPFPSCASYQSGRDIWYTVPAPASGNLSIEVNSVASVSWAIQTYTGICSGLNLLECSNGVNILQELTNLTPAEDIIIRLWSENNIVDGEFDICAYETPAENYLCSLASSISCGSSLIGETTVGSIDNGDVTGCTYGVGLWYKFEPNNSSIAEITITPEAILDVAISVSSSSDCSSFTNIVCTDDVGVGAQETLTFSYTVGTTYYIYVGDSSDTGINIGLFDISLNCANDDCGQAEVLEVGAYGQCNNIVRSNVNATASGELPVPSCPAFGDGKDNWFSVTAPSSGFLTIQMSDAGGPGDWVMEVYSGGCGTLTSVACNDDYNSLFPTIFLENQTPGSTLLVRVWEYLNDELGDFNICAFETPQENYLCTTATSLICGQEILGESNERSLDTDTGLGCSGIGVGVWYKYEPVQDGNLILEVDPDATLAVEVAVVTSTDCMSFTNVACSSDILGAGVLATVSFSAVVGNTYYFYVGDRIDTGTNTGLFDISLNSDSPPINDDCTNAYLLSVNTTCYGILADNTCASPSGELPLPSCGNFGGGQDLWYSITVPGSGNTVVRIEEVGGPSNWQMEAYSGVCGTLVADVCSSNSVNGTTLLNIMGSTPGETLLIRVWENGSDESGLFSICATEFAAPVNDDCTSATELVCGANLEDESLDLASNNGIATGCNYGSGVWYIFEPDNSGTATVEVTGDGFSPGVSVSTSTDCITFTNIDCQGYTGFTASSTFAYVAGTTYYIYVANPFYDFGNFDISFSTASPPVNDECIGAIALSVNLAGQCTNVLYDNYCASNSDNSIPRCFSNIATVWFSAIIPPSGKLNVELSGGNLDNSWTIDLFKGTCNNLILNNCYTSNGPGNYPMAIISNFTPGEEVFLKINRIALLDQGTFDICAYEPLPTNNLCSTSKNINCATSYTNETINGSTENGDDTGCDMGNGIWYKYEAIESGSTTITVTPIGGFDPEVSLSTTTDCISFTNVACSNTSGVESITFTAVSSTIYYIYVGDNCCVSTGYFDIEITAPSPSNDDCINATPLIANIICTNSIGSTNCSSASGELPLPGCAFFNTGEDIWFSAVIPSNGKLNIEISLLNNSYDTGLAAYSGSCGSLSLISCDDDSGAGGFSKIILTDRAPGETILIRVWEYGSNQEIEFNICATLVVENDLCLNATQIDCGQSFLGESTAESTDNGDDTMCSIGVGTWYKFAPTSTGTSTINVSPEASFDIEVSISTSTDCITFTNIACVDNLSNGGLESYLLSHTSGTTYYIYVGDRIGGGSATGLFDISIICENDICDDAINIPIGEPGVCTSIVGTNAASTASGTTPLPICGQFGTGLDNWHKVTVPQSGNLTIELNDGGSGLDWSMEAYTGADCNSLVYYDCAENNAGVGSPEFIYLENLMQGSTVFIRVWKNQANALIELGEYNICAYEELATNLTCDQAISLTCNSTLSNVTNVGSEFNYISPSCYSGRRVWYKYEPIADGTATLTIDPLGTQTSYVDVLTSSDCQNFESVSCNISYGGNININSFIYSANVTYYILAGGNSILNFDISLNCTSCISPDFIAYSDYSDCPNTSGVNFEITDLGNYSGADISNDVTTDVFNNVGIGTYQFTGFTQGQDVKFYIMDTTDPTCIDSTTVSIPLSCPPLNDEVVTAFDVTCGSLLLNETLSNATNTLPANISTCFSGPAVWYEYQSSGIGEMNIKVTPDASLQTSINVYREFDGNLSLWVCATSNLGIPCQTSFTYSEDATFYIMVVKSSSNGPSQYFNIELTCEVFDPPSNDECDMAQLVNIGSQTCGYNYSPGGTTSSEPSSCGGFENDVWFEFVATEEAHNLKLTSFSGSSLVYAIYNGGCGALSEGYCSGTGQETFDDVLQGFVIGETYYIRVGSDGNTSAISSFEICITLPECEDELNLMGSINTDQYYSTDGIITSTQIIEDPANIDYNSGTEIDLLPGFEVKVGAQFNAFIDGCVNVGGGIQLDFN